MQREAPILESETSDVGVLAPTGPHRLLLGGSLGAEHQGDQWQRRGSEGPAQAAPASNFVVDPNNRYFYVAETMWTRLNRGHASGPAVPISDDRLKLVTEIPLLGRLISVPKSPALDISADGKLAFVYNMQPAASVAVVDLVARKTANVVEIPRLRHGVSRGAELVRFAVRGWHARLRRRSRPASSP